MITELTQSHSQNSVLPCTSFMENKSDVQASCVSASLLSLNSHLLKMLELMNLVELLKPLDLLEMIDLVELLKPLNPLEMLDLAELLKPLDQLEFLNLVELPGALQVSPSLF